MGIVDVIHLAATSGFCTLLWVVQLVIYPQMATVREADFTAYHARHMRRITRIVAPLFMLEGLAATTTFWLGWHHAPWIQSASVLLFFANSAFTFLWFVPAHQRLAAGGMDEDLLRRLVVMNAWRTGLSSLRLMVVMPIVAHFP